MYKLAVFIWFLYVSRMPLFVMIAGAEINRENRAHSEVIGGKLLQN
jgi:surface polysaccharide O-acyltransferase-like enzyme